MHKNWSNAFSKLVLGAFSMSRPFTWNQNFLFSPAGDAGCRRNLETGTGHFDTHNSAIFENFRATVSQIMKLF